MHWLAGLALCLMAGGVARGSAVTCDASNYNAYGILCPITPPSTYQTPGQYTDGIYSLNFNFFDDVGLKTLISSDCPYISCASNLNIFTPCSTCSLYGFSGVSLFKNINSVIVGVTTFNNYQGAFTTARYNKFWNFGTVSGTPSTFFCPPGSIVIGYYALLNNDNPQHFTDLVLICGPLYCPAAQYPTVDAQSCNNCAVGTYSLGCTSNTIQNFVSSCKPCTNGYPLSDPNAVVYTSSGTSALSCQFTCAAGYGKSNSQGTSTQCGKCNAGYYNPSQGGACTPCSAGSVSPGIGTITCTACIVGSTYQPGTGQVQCQQCTTVGAIAGTYITPCTSTKNYDHSTCTGCNAGYYLSPACGSTDSSAPAPQCTACPAGTRQSAIIPLGYTKDPYICTQCSAGFYQPLEGQASCNNCPAPPQNGQFAPWQPYTSFFATANALPCPVQCNVGYGWNSATASCLLCPKGKYAAGGLPLADCKTCSQVLDTNAYWLEPVVFNRGYDGCPWDCNAGYFKIAASKTCSPCLSQTYSATMDLSADDSGLANSCKNCRTCSATIDYETTPCLKTQNRVCSPCTIQCQGGYYLTTCTPTSNSACVSCGTCASGKYIIGACSGNEYSNTITCVNCSAPSTCVSGLYMPPGQCSGSTGSNSVCAVCKSLACNAGYYQRPCSLNTDTACVPYTQCNAGYTLWNRGLTSDGVCQPCTVCSTYGLATAAACSQYADTLCSGASCSGASPCTNTPDRNFFCNMDLRGAQKVQLTDPGVCGMCPDGYSSDGMYCYECPSTKTCSRTGAVLCAGEVSPGYEPWCYGEYAQPSGAACPVPNDQTRIVTRSTFIQPNGNCAPYFRCKAGYFKHFNSIGQVFCDACDATTLPVNFAWFSDGLSPNDPLSCVSECAGASSWPDGACFALSSVSYIPANAQGYYDDGTGAPKPCPSRTTSAPGRTVSASGCKPCTNPQGSLGDPCDAWTCPMVLGSQLQKIGDACYDPFQCPLSMVGYSYDMISGKCMPTPLPWQGAGYQKLSLTQVNSLIVNVVLVNSNWALPESVTAVCQVMGGLFLLFF